MRASWLGIAILLAALAYGTACPAIADTRPASQPATGSAPASRPAPTSVPASQPAAPPTQIGSLSAAVAELLQAAQQALDAKPPPPEALLTVYSQAKSRLDKARSDLAKGKVLLAEAAAAPARHMAVKAQLKAEAAPLPTTFPARYSLAEVEQFHTVAKRTLGELTEARQLADARSRNLERRIGEIPDELSRAAQELAEARKLRDGPPPEDKPAGMATAKELLRKAESLCAAATLRLLESERENAGAVGEVVRAELTLAERRVDHAQKVEKLWSEALKAKRREQGLELVRKSLEMQQEFADKDEALRDLCAENLMLAMDASAPTGVIARLRVAVEQQRQTVSRLNQIQSDYKEIQARLRLTGVTKGFGGLLIEHRDRLPLRNAIEGRLAASRRELNEAQLRSLQLREKSRDARKDGPAMWAALRKMPVAPDTPEWRGARQAARRILENRRELLTEIAQSYTKYQRTLSETIATEQELLDTVDEVKSFVEEKVLWVRNMPGLGLDDFRLARQAIRDLDFGHLWSDVASDLQEDFQTHPIAAGSSLLAVLVLLVGRVRLWRRIRYLGRGVTEHPPGTFRDTLETLLWTLVSGAAWPVLLWVTAWRLTATAPSATTTLRLAEGLNTVAYLLLLVCLVREFCQPDGLAAAHAKRDLVRLAGLRKVLLLVIPLVLPFVYLSVVMNARPTNESRQAVARLSSIMGQLVLSGLLIVLLRRKGPVVCGRAEEQKTGLLYRGWWFWYPLVVAVPVVLAAAAGAGYYYSAQEIGARLYLMVSLVLGMRSLRTIVLRGLWLARRRMVRQEVHKTRQAEQKIEEEGDRDVMDSLLRETVEQVTSVSDQTARFVTHVLRFALFVQFYLMWQDLLPAFRFLSHTNLYAIGEVHVMLADILVAILAGVVTVLAVRTLPGILDVYLLSRSRMDMRAMIR